MQAGRTGPPAPALPISPPPAVLAAQQVLRFLLDGSPLPVTLLEADYGPWAETVHALHSAHTQGGRDAAHRAFVAMSLPGACPGHPAGWRRVIPRSRPCGAVAELYAASCLMALGSGM